MTQSTLMTYFPQPNPADRAKRVTLGGAVVVAIRSEGTSPIRAKLHKLSVTGGLLILAKPLGQGDFVEVAFQTSKGVVHGMAEILRRTRESTAGCLQPFRFLALGDGDHTRLRMALDGELEHAVLPSSSTPSPHCIGILMSAAGRFLECGNCQLSFEFPAGEHYDTIAEQFESHSCSSPIPSKDNAPQWADKIRRRIDNAFGRLK